MEKDKSRFIPFRSQADTYLARLDVCYGNFDAENFELVLKGKPPSTVERPNCTALETLKMAAKRYKTHDFKSVLNRPHYTCHFRSKMSTDENVMKFKLLQLFENNRPPYFGTLSTQQQSIIIPKKNPFYTHAVIYCVDWPHLNCA